MGLGRSASSKAAWAVRHNTLTNTAGQTIIKVSKSNITGPRNGITQKTNAKGGIDRNYYGPDGRQTKQISNNGHGHKVEEALGKHGEHAHDYIFDAEGHLCGRPSRELTDAERKENSGYFMTADSLQKELSKGWAMLVFQYHGKEGH